MRFGLLLLLLPLLAAGPAPADGNPHVRVVLDVSGSMKSNDPNRLTILSTLLLYDLARPNPTIGDSFEVLPFDQNWSWTQPGDPPPESTRPRIVAEYGQRQKFVRALNQQTYDSRMTYFLPGLRSAVEDLGKTPGGAYDVRVIVLVTDGVPEAPIRDREAELIASEIVPALQQHGIRLYVLAFSNEAYSNKPFFDAMVKDAAGNNLGEVFVDPDGRRLLANMLLIFARSFGYTPDAALDLPGVASLNLEGNTKPERVAVAVLSDRPARPPRLDLAAPPGGTVNNPGGIQSAREKNPASNAGASYSLTWVLAPSDGGYGFDTDVLKGSVAVLRPTRLVLEILPVPPFKQTERTMARTPFRLGVRVKSPIGAVGDPGPVDLSYRALGQREKDPETGVTDHAWTGDKGAPANATGNVTPEGRLYEIVVEFREDKTGKPYAGYLEVEARRGEAVVGSLRLQHAHRVEVHPLLSIVPFPLNALVSNQALERWQQACTRFTLDLDAGELPRADDPDYGYSLRAVLEPGDPLVLERELNQAVFTLDGQSLEVEGKPSDPPGKWYKGRSLKAAELLAEHLICAKIGKPVHGDPATPIELPLVFTLNETPYDDFRVVEAFTARILIAPPSMLQRWGTLILLGLAALALLASLWYLRDRPELPGDLRYAVGRDSSAARMTPHRLGEGSLLKRLAGLTVERPVVVDSENRTLGWVRPVSDELYRLRPVKGGRVDDVERDTGVPVTGGTANLAVHRLYRITSNGDAYLFRVEYE